MIWRLVASPCMRRKLTRSLVCFFKIEYNPLSRCSNLYQLLFIPVAFKVFIIFIGGSTEKLNLWVLNKCSITKLNFNKRLVFQPLTILPLSANLIWFCNQKLISISILKMSPTCSAHSPDASRPSNCWAWILRTLPGTAWWGLRGAKTICRTPWCRRA